MKSFKERYVSVPDNLESLTQIDREAECVPEAVGLSAGAVRTMWASVEDFYRTGVHPAITIVVRKQGKIVLKRAIGCASGNEPGGPTHGIPLSPDAPISLFSASKAVSALLVHKLVEDGKLSLDDCVAKHIPQFAMHGKGDITIRQLMAHRAGIPVLPLRDPDPSLLRHWGAIIDLLSSAKPFFKDRNRQAYHALTAGFILGEVVRRTSGRELPELLHEWIAEPLGCKYLTFGLAPEHRVLSPLNTVTGPKPFWPMSSYLERILGVSLERAVEASNSEVFMSSVVPAGNIYASADDASRVFQMLLNGGVFEGKRLFKAETVAEAIKPVGDRQFDAMLRVPLRFSAGFMLGDSPVGLFGLKSHRAFGHLGFVSVLCWADPKRDISVAMLNTGKTLSTLGGVRFLQVIASISKVCPIIQ